METAENNPTNTIFEGYLTKKQFAAQIGKTERTVDRMALNGDGPPRTRIGRTTLCRIEGVLEWLRSRETPARPLRKLRGGLQ